jgi:hypothetical protein
VSNDGTRYAYAEGNAFLQNAVGRVHVVDLKTRADRVIYQGSTVYSVVDFAGEGIYLSGAAPEGAPHGLWLMNPATGAVRLISRTIEDPHIGGGAAWGVDFNAADPSPGPGGLAGPRNRVLRLDLKTGAITYWFYRPGTNLYVAGLNAGGHPFVVVGSPGDSVATEIQDLWLVTSPTTSTKLYAGTASGHWPSRLAAIDSHGMWFSSSSYQTTGGVVWLYTGGAIRIVASPNLDYLQVAGGCI